jgi:hypothetical protein
MRRGGVVERDRRFARDCAVDDASMLRGYRLIVFCAVSLGGTSLGSVARAQTSGPVASYALSEGTGTAVADTSGNDNAGEFTAPASWTAGGRFGNGLLLAGGAEGSAEGIRVPASSSLDVASALTLEAWICPASVAGYPKIVWRDGDGGSPYNLAMAYGNGTLVFGVLTTAGSFRVFAYSSLAANVWTHVAGTYDGASLRLYMDGTLINSASASGTIVPGTRDLWLGRAPWGEGFTGRYDEVRIYDRALTAAEIASDRDTQINGLDPPEVGSRSPAPDSMGVPPATIVTATFSKPMDAATLTGSSFYLSGPSGNVPATLAYDAATHSVTLTPTAPLAKLTRYTAHVTTAVADLDEGSLGSVVAWTFTTSPDPALAHAAYAFSEGAGGTVADSSANGNTAALPTPGLWTSAGKYGNGLLLGGGTDGARISASASLEVASSVTLETWLYATSIANYPKLIWRDGLEGAPYNLGMAWGNGSIGFGVTTTDGSFNVWAYRSIVPNVWTHVAATYDGSMLRIYVDGQQANASVATGSIVASTRDLWLGRAPWGEGFTGTLDEVRVYSRALTAAEIAIDIDMPVTHMMSSPPTLSVAPGTYNTPQSVVVTNVLGPAAEVHYTTSGIEPTQADPIVADGVSLTVDRTTTIKLRAWATGRWPSATITAAYVLQPDIPSITPGTGTYTTPQTVSITSATTNTVIRYTVDGIDPTASSPVYNGRIDVGTFTVLKAKAFREGWTPSATATTTFAFEYGTLVAPVAHPAGGTYASGQFVALEAQDGAQVQYTLNGTDPDLGSTPYIAPFQLPDGLVTLKAKAFKVDWTASVVTSESYTVGDDTLPPTITASMAPEANLAGWNNSDVTVSFRCLDPSAIVVCTAPLRVRGEGYGLPVTGAATDEWGNHASTTWTVNIDHTPPAVHVYVPGEAWNFPSETTSVTIRGGAAELSGLQAVSCNGVEAAVTGNLFVCRVSVSPGPNNVTIRASDIAGNNSSTAIAFTVGDADIKGLEISPGTMTMFAGDSREITVADRQGNEVHQGEWSVLDPSVAEVSESDGSTVVTALAAGETRLSVAFRGHTAHATVTVFAAGGTLPAGTTLWSLNDASGLGVPNRGEVLRATSTTADGDAAKAPALLFVDQGAEWSGNTLVQFEGHPTRIRTTTVDGRQLSDVSFAGRIPQQIAADNDGGFVVVLPASGGFPSTIQRWDSRSGSIAWEYVATSGYLSDVAIHPDGTVYAAEGHVVGINYLVGIRSSGLVQRTLLPQGQYTQVDTGTCGLDSIVGTPGYVTGPIVLDDGSVAVVTKVRESQRIVFSYPDERLPGGCGVQSHPQDYSFTDISWLLQLSSSGARVVHLLGDSAQRIPLQFYPDDSRLMPDGHGGLLLGKRKTPSVVRIDRDYQVVATNATILPVDGSTRYETEYVLSEDGAYALVNSVRTISLRPFAYAYESKVVQFDPETLQEISDAVLGVPMTEPQHLRLKFALAGGGVYAVGPTAAFVVNPTVDVAGFAAGGNATHVASGLWSGWSGTGTPSSAPGTEPVIAQNRWAYTAGLENANAPTPRLLTTTRLRELAAERGIAAGLTGIQLNRAIGLAFQGVAIWSLYQSASNTFKRYSPLRNQVTAGAVQNVIPDYIAMWRHGNSEVPYPDGVYTEVKAVAGLIRLPYSQFQTRGLIDAVRTWFPLSDTIHWPMVEFLTTSDTEIGLDVVAEATARRVEVRQRKVLELAGGYLQVGPGRSLNGSIWTILTERTALPAMLPGRAIGQLGSHPGLSAIDDPDPPSVEP